MPKRNKPELDPNEYLRFVEAAYEHDVDSALDHLDEPKQQDSMPKRKEPELTPAEQKKRFEALAREVGAKQSPDQFKRTLKSAMDLRRKGKPKLK